MATPRKPHAVELAWIARRAFTRYKSLQWPILARTRTIRRAVTRYRRKPSAEFYVEVGQYFDAAPAAIERVGPEV